MGLFYSVSPKKLLDVRNEIFVKHGIPTLKRNGFEKSPFPETLFGKNNLGDYTYDLCRLNSKSQLEIVTTHISRGDRWIKIYLNIFHLEPTLKSLEQLRNVNGIQFRLPPNSLTKMRLRIDDFKGMPLLNFIEHRIKSFYSERGFQKRVVKLSELIEADLNNINSFVKSWNEFHQPMITSWDGKKIDKKNK